MYKPRALLITTNLNIREKVIKSFGKTNVVVVNDFEVAIAELTSKHNITTIIVDYFVQEKRTVHSFMKLRLLLGPINFYIIVTREFANELDELGVEKENYCIFPCDGEEITAWGLTFAKSNIAMVNKKTIWRDFFFKSPFGVGIVQDSDPEKSMFNKRFAEIIGRDPYTILGSNYGAFTHPDDRAKEKKLLDNVRESGVTTVDIEKRIFWPNGELRWVSVHYNMLYLEGDESYITFVIIQDITKQRKLESNLRDTIESKTRIVQSIPGTVYRCKNDKAFTMEYLSKQIESLSGYKPAELINNKLLSYENIIVKKHRQMVHDAVDEMVRTRKTGNFQYQIKTKNNKIKWVLEQCEAIFDKNGDVIGIEGVILDIDNLKKAEKELEFKSLFDEQTKLPNRKSFIADIEKINLDKKHTFITINLSDIRRTSSVHGHDYYLNVKNSLSDKMKEISISRAKLYLTEEEHFTYHFRYHLSEEKVTEFYNAVREQIIGTLRREMVRCGFGVTYTQECTRDLGDIVIGEQILNRTLMASEEALRTKSLIEIKHYTEELQNTILREEMLVTELRELMRSFEFGGLAMHYQPVFSIKTGKPIGFEALARYNSAKFGYINPLELFELAEKNRFSVVLGLKIFRLSFAFLARLKALGYERQIVSVNLSTTQLLDQMLPDKLEKLATEFDIDLTRLVLELTEHIYAENFEKINESVSALSNLGIRLAIDDFGTGYSSLSLIQDMEFWSIKIDRAFVSKLTHETKDKLIAGDIVSMCLKLADVIVAEGIETKEQYEIMQNYNCNYAQGYYLARPMPEDDAVDFLNKFSL